MGHSALKAEWPFFMRFYASEPRRSTDFQSVFTQEQQEQHEGGADQKHIHPVIPVRLLT
jgi:hypothetical protein